MAKIIRHILGTAAILASLIFFAANAYAHIEGISGLVFNLTAKDGYISTGEGNSIYTWGYADSAGPMQYPGPTLIVNQGDVITVNLANELTVPVSIVFPGQTGVAAAGGADGILTKEAPPAGTVTYQFTALSAGTYLYHSGTRPEVQVEMGLVGALIVRPLGFNPMMPTAYGSMDSEYTMHLEFLFLLTEMDPRIHEVVRRSGIDALQNTNYLSNYFPTYWFLNGRTAPDTMYPANAAWLPHQPYDSMPMMHPGDKLLMRVIGGGRQYHPWHHHGNHSRVIARDGRLLESMPGSGMADLSHEVFTIQSAPGETTDAIFTWTGEGLNWDAYGPIDATCTDADNDGLDDATFAFCHDAACADTDVDGFDDATHEYCADHGKAFPVLLPEKQDSTFGGFYPGSPFLGKSALLPPLQGGLNPNAGFVYMWHSHTEKELTNFDIFPGGMMTMLMVLPSWVPLM